MKCSGYKKYLQAVFSALLSIIVNILYPCATMCFFFHILPLNLKSGEIIKGYQNL